MKKLIKNTTSLFVIAMRIAIIAFLSGMIINFILIQKHSEHGRLYLEMNWAWVISATIVSTVSGVLLFLIHSEVGERILKIEKFDTIDGGFFAKIWPFLLAFGAAIVGGIDMDNYELQNHICDGIIIVAIITFVILCLFLKSPGHGLVFAIVFIAFYGMFERTYFIYFPNIMFNLRIAFLGLLFLRGIRLIFTSKHGFMEDEKLKTN